MRTMLRMTVCGMLVALAGCATVPTGPSVRVLPAPGKSFEQFQADDAVCRQWSGQQIGLSPQDNMNQNTATGATVGTVLGAGLGAAVGAASGHPGAGAAIGAGSGLLIGTAAGSDNARVYGAEAQRRYDIAYQQCMYAKGNQLPGVVQKTKRVRKNYYPPPGSYPAPSYQTPPPGSYPVPPDYSPR